MKILDNLVNNKKQLVLLMIVIPVILSFFALKWWDKYTQNMNDKKKQQLTFKIGLVGTIITSTAIIYAIIFNLYEVEKLAGV